MKKLLSLLICLLICLSFVGCGKENKATAAKKDGVITSAEELLAISENPSKKYKLGANIDLGGKEWKPIKNFSGTLTGVWGGEFNYTISNFKLKASKNDTAVGFFATLSGKVADVNFSNVTLETEDGFSGSAGIVAGKCTSKLESVKALDCTVTGKVKDAAVGLIAGNTEKDIIVSKTTGEINLTSTGNSFIGGVTGKGNDFDRATSDCALTVSVKSGVCAAGGITGYGSTVSGVRFGGKLNLTAKDGASLSASQFAGNAENVSFSSYANARHTSISGEGKIVSGVYNCIGDDNIAVDCVTRDLKNLEEKVLNEKQYKMRKTVVDKMYEQCTVAWSPTKKMYSVASTNIQNYLKGEWYFGLPYTHNCGSIEKMRAYLDKNGKVLPEVKESRWDKLLGNDCADCVYWALASVSASPTFVLTDGMICENGLVAVGTYEIKKDDSGRRSSHATCKGTTAEAMYENYALLQMGDAIVKGPVGHTRLVAENAYIYRNADGSINGDKSYIVTHEQGAGTGSLPKRHTTCKINGKSTFASLYNGGYIPVTIPDYETGEKTPYKLTFTVKDTTADGLKSAMVGSNYRINYITVDVTDGNKTVQTKTVYPCTGKHLVQYKMQKMIDDEFLSKLEDKKEYTVCVYINGKEKENIAYKEKLKK